LVLNNPSIDLPLQIIAFDGILLNIHAFNLQTSGKTAVWNELVHNNSLEVCFFSADVDISTVWCQIVVLSHQEISFAFGFRKNNVVTVRQTLVRHTTLLTVD
jgi:hypothetical protein